MKKIDSVENCVNYIEAMKESKQNLQST